jgi:hypothetical protein
VPLTGLFRQTGRSQPGKDDSDINDCMAAEWISPMQYEDFLFFVLDMQGFLEKKSCITYIRYFLGCDVRIGRVCPQHRDNRAPHPLREGSQGQVQADSLRSPIC